VTLQSLTDAAFDYAKTGFDIALGLVASMVLFLGLMKVGEAAGIVQLVARLLHPVEGNEVFVELGETAIARLAAAGFGFYRWGEAPVLRLVTAFDSAGEAVESFLRVARETLGGAPTP